jgi:hypothetical protein
MQHNAEYRRKIETLVSEAAAGADRGVTQPLVGGPGIAGELLGLQQECRTHEQEELHLNEQLYQGVDGTSCSEIFSKKNASPTDGPISLTFVKQEMSWLKRLYRSL